MSSPLFPVDLLARPDLSPGAKCCAIAILWHCRPADERMTAWPSNARLAAMLGTSLPSVHRYLRELRDAGVIRRREDNGRRMLDFIAEGVSDTTRAWGIGSDTGGVSDLTRGGIGSAHQKKFLKKRVEKETPPLTPTPHEGQGNVLILTKRERAAGNKAMSEVAGDRDEERKAVMAALKRKGLGHAALTAVHAWMLAHPNMVLDERIPLDGTGP